LRYLSLFSGIEAASVAWNPLGWECVGVAEIEKFPCKVLAHHYPDVPNLGDITKITETDIAELGLIDVVVFGAPCQDLSVAGKRKGMLDAHGNITRSGLFFTAINIVTWARKHCACRFAIYENVPGLFSSNKGADFASVVEHMAGLDDVTAPKNGWGSEGCAVGDEGMVEWACLDAQFVRTPEFPTAVPQRRRRVFAIADFGDWSTRPPILLERESLRGDTPSRRSKRQETPRDVVESSGSGGAIGALFPAYFKGAASQCADQGNVVGCYGIAGNIIGRQPDNGGNGDGYSNNIGYTLTKTDVHAVVYPINTQIATRCVTLGEGTGLGMANEGKSAYTHQAAHCHAVAFSTVPDICGTMKSCSGKSVTWTNSVDHAAAGYILPMDTQVRRLTPMECERLQGFPENYTGIHGASDTARYKALGNSMACNVMHYIGQQIQKAVDYNANP
jgi:DNA (cytosine-5)-methyltransferase 1